MSHNDLTDRTRRVVLHICAVLGTVEMAALCYAWNQKGDLSVKTAIFLMAAAGGLLAFSINLIESFRKIERQVPPELRGEVRREGFRQLNGLFSTQSLLMAMLFCYHVQTPPWVILPLIKVGLLWLVVRPNVI